MPKRGYKHKTGIFGTDAEDYVARLFWMMKHPQGHRRPDLVSINGRYNPKLSLEVKSGINGKVSLVSYQLHYGVRTEQDYINLFGEDCPVEEIDFFGHLGKNTVLPRGNVAYYYDIISRDGSVKSGDVGKPNSSIQIDWQDQMFVPHEMIFYAFAIARHLRDATPIDDVKSFLFEQMKKDIEEQHSHYKENKGKQDWQNFYARDVLAIHQNNDEVATEFGRERIRLLRDNYPGFDTLERILIPGPNGTKMYVLANPEDVDLFDRQVRSTVEERIPVIEEISREREKARGLLEKIHNLNGEMIFDGNVTKPNWYLDLTKSQIELLRRLSRWAPGYEPLIIKSDEETAHEIVERLDESELPSLEELESEEVGNMPI